MNISIIGTGYVGLVTGTCLADFSAGRLTFTTDLENQVSPSLRATEGSAAIPPSVIARSSSTVIPAKEAVSQLPRSRTINELKNINKKQIKPLFYKTFN